MRKYKIEQNTFLNKLVAVPFYLRLLRKYNTLEAEYEALQECVKDDLFTKCLKSIETEEYILSLENEISKLKDKIKSLKENK